MLTASKPTSLTFRPAAPHGLNAEFVVFDMLADIDAVVLRHLRRSEGHTAWVILQRMFEAHLTQRELHFADLWLQLDQPRERTLETLERLVDDGYVRREPDGEDGLGDRLALTAEGATRLAELAQRIGEIVARACRKAGPDPFAFRGDGAIRSPTI